MTKALIVRFAAAFLALGAASAQTPPEPADYRMDEYRAPTPATLAGALVLDVSAVEALWREKTALFVDVMPRTEKPPNLPAGTIWRDKKRETIPGGVWLPNVGYGKLSPDMDAYFQRSLYALADGDKSRLLLFYCQAECWMSWNAAKRALSLGYSKVAWFPEGTDGWAKAGLPLVEGVPQAR